MKRIVVTLLVLLTILPSVFAHTDANVTEIEQIINQQIPCSQLTDEQLEAIGDYYMELMHPGQAHEIMDQMMGGEGSESLRQMHILMARRIYCGENQYTFEGVNNYGAYGMMGGMMMYPYWGWGMGFWYFGMFFFLFLLLLILIVAMSSSRPARTTRVVRKKRRIRRSKR